MSPTSNKPQPTQPVSNQTSEPAFTRLHPHEMAMYLFMAGISMLFFGFIFAYWFTKGNWHWDQFSFPKIFLLSTLCLVLSSYTIHRAVKNYELDNAHLLIRNLGWTAILSIAFLILQIVGWLQLSSIGVKFAGKPNGSYLYLISGVHALHVIGGIAALLVIFIKTIQYINHPVNELIHFSDPQRARTLKLIARYWHYVDVLWVFLLIFFLLNHL